MFNNKVLKIVEKFGIYAIVALAIIAVGVVFMFINGGLNLGIDFTGGTTIEIDLGSFASDASVQSAIEEKVTSILDENGCKMNGAMQFSSATSNENVTCEIRLSYYHDGDIKTKEGEQEFIDFIQGDLEDNTNNGLCGVIEDALKDMYPEDVENNCVKAHTVGATASSALLRNAIIATIVAIVVMLVYIIIRFTFTSALAAVCALAHDVLIMVALTAIFGITVNSTFIAAIITIIGYSINATIIIFDRVREEIKLEGENGTRTDAEIANYSVTKTLSRTILTTLTTLIMVLLLAFVSVTTIREFIIPIIFGLVAGTFSSTMLAPSMWVIFRKLGKKMQSNKKEKSGYVGATKGAKES